MVCLTAKSLGEAWIKSIELVLQKGNVINDEEILLKEIQNLYITINEVNEDDVILKKYADQERIELMKKKYFTCGLVGTTR